MQCNAMQCNAMQCMYVCKRTQGRYILFLSVSGVFRFFGAAFCETSMLGDVCGWLVLNSMLSDRLQFNVLQTQSLSCSFGSMSLGVNGLECEGLGLGLSHSPPLSRWKPLPLGFILLVRHYVLLLLCCLCCCCYLSRCYLSC